MLYKNVSNNLLKSVIKDIDTKAGCIYTLACPDSGLVRYVGQTTDLKKRYNLHLFHSKNGRANTHKEKWINSLINVGKKPLLDIVWQGPIQQLDQKETEFIALFKSFGARLTNATLGGLTTRGRKCSEETKQKFREMFKGKCLRPPITEEEKKALSERRKGIRLPEASIEKMRATKKGKPSHWIKGNMPQDVLDRWHAAAKAKSQPIIAIKEGVEYPFASVMEAVRQTGCDRTSIRRFLEGKRRKVKGYTFRRA